MNKRRSFAAFVAFSLAVTSMAAPAAQAAKKPKLKKKLTVNVAQTKKIKIKKLTAKQIKKITWKVSKKHRKIFKIRKKGKLALKVTGLKTGKGKITAQIKAGNQKYKLTCNVTVKDGGDETTGSSPSPTDRSMASTTPDASGNPLATASETGAATGAPDLNTPATSTVPSATPASTAPEGTVSDQPLEDPLENSSEAPEEEPSTSPVETEAASLTEPTPFQEYEFAAADFEDGLDGFTGRYAQVSLTTDGHQGGALMCSGRTSTWNGAKLDVSECVSGGALYEISAWVKVEGEEGTEETIKIGGEYDGNYPTVVQADVPAGEWTLITGSIEVPTDFSSFDFYFEVPSSATANFYVDDVTITQKSEGKPSSAVSLSEQTSMKEAYAEYFPNMGTCFNSYQMSSQSNVDFVKKHYNSITLENEMKPQRILSSGRLSVEEAKEEGYVIPENYADENVPKIQFDTLDQVMEFCADAGIRMRGHTLLWHQQTPSWFFTTGYSGSTPVTPEVMDGRLEFYVKTVMSHIMEKEKALGLDPGSVVYCYDVVNEYLNHTSDPTSVSWVDVYGEQNMSPEYVKKAYEFAYEELKEYGAENDVTLFYNDYNTYFNVDKVVELVQFVNQGEEANILGGIGMQSHLDVKRPGVGKYESALETFLATGLEVQITELDVTINYVESGQDDEDQARYVKSLMETIIYLNEHRDQSVNPKGITGITLWGLYDSVSWRRSNTPLLFSTGTTKPKPSYYSFLEAVTDWEEDYEDY